MKIVFTPDWFVNNDVLIGIFSFLILFLFFLFSMKSFNLSRKRSVLYLGLGFLVIALGELSAVLTKLVLFYDTEITKEVGRAIITSQVVNTIDIFYYIGFFFQRFLTLTGLYVIYKIPYKKMSSEFFFGLYLILVVSLLSHNLYFLYNLTAFVLLLLIITNYSEVYKKERLASTKILITSFSLLAIAHLTFMFSKINFVYVVAQNIQLVGYLILLVLVIRIILKNGKKKK